ncbi:Pectate lyase superfamily protein [Paenibacillus konkukensis]|uniref:Pectate lyase superfamily protein n=1 Tax=Paenibacillus konkukensis TaxID=2020716 RepID=A0ABY4RQG7_9BACL|nr:right-handed parallel beta-helix repeat-containing protein [Paenibacillus konkukensis]UQZ84026.1 Pectate lyase superfamily protein [Paenibacillus konkukensis]
MDAVTYALAKSYTKERFDNVSIDIKSYGAVGDGITNDTTAINLAIAALKEAIQINGRASLFVPMGTFMVDGIIIQGLNNFKIYGNGCLKLNRARPDYPLVNTNNVLTMLNCTNFDVSGLEVVGNRHTDINWRVDNTDGAPVTQYLTADAESGQAYITVQDGSKFVIGERVWVMGGLTVNNGNERDVREDDHRGLEIIEINGNVIKLENNLSHTYTSTGQVGGAYITTYQTADNNQIGGWTLGNEDQQNGIHLINCHYFAIHNCYVHDLWESPIKLGVGFAAEYTINSVCSHGIISNNRCLRGYDQGISIWNSQNINVIGNICEDVGWGGIVATGSDDILITDNISTNNYYRIPHDNSSGHGIVNEGGTRVSILNNQVSLNYAHGILMSPSPMSFGVDNASLNDNMDWRATVLKLTSNAGFLLGANYMVRDGSKSESFKVVSIDGNGGKEVNVAPTSRFFHKKGRIVGKRAAEDSRIEGNIVSYQVNGDGICITSGIRITINNNHVERNATNGIRIVPENGFESSAIIINGNYLTGNSNNLGWNAEIYVHNCDDVHVVNNRLFGSFNSKGIQFRGVRNSRISGNEVNDCQSEGIFLEWADGVTCDKITICDNDVKQCDGIGIKVDIGFNLLVEGNSLWSNAGDGGLVLGGVAYSTIQGNRCIGNNVNGILLRDNGNACKYNIVQGNIVRDDGSSVKGSDGSKMTQGTSIKLQDNEDHNIIKNNIVDVAVSTVGTNTVVSDNILISPS